MMIRQYLADSLRRFANRIAPPLPDLRQVPLLPDPVPPQAVVTVNGVHHPMHLAQALALNQGIDAWNTALRGLPPVVCTPISEKAQ